MAATESLWESTAPASTYPRLESDDGVVDVAIIGGGITGITTALLLKEAGRKVAVLDARTVASGVTGGTTAHLTEVLDVRYRTLARGFGSTGARLANESSRSAIEEIARLVEAYSLECGFERLPGFLFAVTDEQADELAAEGRICDELGIAAKLEAPSFPVPLKTALRFENQGQFHPRQYVLGLARGIAGDGSHVFERTRVLTIDEGEPCRLHTDTGATLTARKVVMATHAPLNRVLLQTKLAHYRSYAVSGPIESFPRGLFWDMQDPYHYIRTARIAGNTHLVVGGEDHKTGKDVDTEASLTRLSDYAGTLGLARVTRGWSAQIVEPVDGLPFIGRNAGSSLVYVATGYSGNGMTFGTLAAMILRDACLDRKNPYSELYEATRFKLASSLPTYLAENVDFPMHILSDAMRPPDVASVREIAPGQGAIARVEGERLAVYRDAGGALHGVTPICTHLGCHVKFNATEKTWDCPCHGSRFDVDGSVIDGPALSPLKRREI